ncbi:MAG: FadR family transcriptional regulator [Desulfobacteraceae bacterium]|nr:FadR family transcriptional regulator [Desulfobacteraceae bacterium]
MKMNEIFTTIKPLKVSDEIVRHIKSLITRGILDPGEKLPAERSLASLFGVGRSTLREAMNTLSTLGFIEIRKRQGAFVKSLGETVIPDSFAQIMDEDQTKVKYLYELRMDLEVASSFMAAKNRSAEDLQIMDRLLGTMESQVSEPRLGIGEDIKFHMAIANASRNILRVHVLENLFTRYGHYIDIARRPFFQGKSHNEEICSHHRQILSAIEQQQPDEARDAMRAHLRMVAAQWD